MYFIWVPMFKHESTNWGHYFLRLSIGWAPGIEPATSRSAVKRSPDLANPATVIYLFIYLLFIYYW